MTHVTHSGDKKKLQRVWHIGNQILSKEMLYQDQKGVTHSDHYFSALGTPPTCSLRSNLFIMSLLPMLTPKRAEAIFKSYIPRVLSQSNPSANFTHISQKCPLQNKNEGLLRII